MIYENKFKSEKTHKIRETFKDGELEDLFSVASKPYEKLLYFILLATGMPTRQALYLKVDNYDISDIHLIKGDIRFENGFWVVCVDNIPNGKNMWKKSYCHQREIQFVDTKCIFEDLLQDYMRWRDEVLIKESSKWLFVSPEGKQLSYYQIHNQFKNSLEKTNIPFEKKQNFTVKSFRYTLMFILVDLIYHRNLPQEYIKRYLGISYDFSDNFLVPKEEFYKLKVQVIDNLAMQFHKS